MTDNIAKRINSIDAFRGFLIILMFLVSSRSPWGQLRHADWFGFHLSDLVYPGFLLSVGISMQISWSAQVDKGIKSSQIYAKILWRCAKLFLIGNILLSISYSSLRFNLGTLQCISLATLLSLPFVRLKFWQKFVAINIIFILTTFLEMYLCLDKNQLWLEGNTFNEHVDTVILGKPKGVEGILSTLNLSTIIILGSLIGNVFISKVSILKKLLYFSSFFLIFGFLVEQLGIPVSPQLATPSFVLTATGIATLTLVLFVVLAERLQLERLIKPFVIYGLNAIAVYVFVRLAQLWFFDVVRINPETTIREYIALNLGAIGFPLTKVVIGYLFCLILFRKRIFFKI